MRSARAAELSPAVPVTRAAAIVLFSFAAGCVDLFHATDWETRCDLDAGACTGSGGAASSSSTGNGASGGGHGPSASASGAGGSGGSAMPVPSCAEATGPSGVYTLDLDGAGPAVPFDAYCDMVTAGGGWTLVLNLDTSDGHVMWWANPLWTDTGAFGTAIAALTADHKSRAWSELTGAKEILLVVHEEGVYLGWKSFEKVDGSAMREHMLGGDNILIGTKVTGSDLGTIDPVERLVRLSTALYANHCVQTGGNCTTGGTGSPDGDRIGSNEGAPSDNNGGGLGNWHDMNFCCDGADYGSGKICNGNAFRTTSEAQAGWSVTFGNERAFGSDTFGAWSCSELELPCSGAAYTCANGLDYDYAIFLR